jgi:hypothetical protein
MAFIHGGFKGEGLWLTGKSSDSLPFLELFFRVLGDRARLFVSLVQDEHILVLLHLFVLEELHFCAPFYFSSLAVGVFVLGHFNVGAMISLQRETVIHILIVYLCKTFPVIRVSTVP